MTLDKIRLVGMSFFARVGTTPEERRVGTHLELDVEMERDLQQAGKQDAITKTIDYVGVYDAVRAAVENKESFLIETVAERVAASLREFKPITVTIRVRKHLPPIPGGRAAYAEVEITRRPGASDE